MSRSPFVRGLVTCAVLCAVIVLAPPEVQTQRDANSADGRLRALYTEEWNWRQKELGRDGVSDRFPRVDAASTLGKRSLAPSRPNSFCRQFHSSV